MKLITDISSLIIGEKNKINLNVDKIYDYDKIRQVFYNFQIMIFNLTQKN